MDKLWVVSMLFLILSTIVLCVIAAGAVSFAISRAQMLGWLSAFRRMSKELIQELAEEVSNGKEEKEEEVETG